MIAAGIIVALLLIALGFAWFYGWYPFAVPTALQKQDTPDSIGLTTAAGGPTLNNKQIDELIKSTTASGAPALSQAQQEQLIKDTTVQ